MNKIIILTMFLLLFFVSIPSKGSTLVISQPDKISDINLSAGFYDIDNQIIINIPYQAMQNLSYVDSITFACGNGTSTEGNYYFRIYRADAIGSYFLEDNFYVNVSACDDYAYEINYPFTAINVSTWYNLNEFLAIGIYGTATAGYLLTMGEDTAIDYLIPDIALPADITNATGQPVYFPDGAHSGEQILTVFHKVYGESVIPTPTPTPTPTPNGTSVPGTTALPDNGTYIVPDDIEGTGYEHYNNSNINISENNTLVRQILNDTGHEMTFQGVEDLIRDYIVLFFWISVVAVGLKITRDD